MSAPDHQHRSRRLQTAGLVLGLVFFFVLLFIPTFDGFRNTAARLIAEQGVNMSPDNLAHAMQSVAALSLMIITFWITEAVPLAVTGLLPLLVLPLLHITGLSRGPVHFTLGTVSPNYANPVIFLFLGGFLLAGGLRKWGIDRRLTLWLLSRGSVASSAGGILLAVMGVSAFLCMWISNTATAAMMLPLGLGILSTLGSEPGKSNYGTALMLGIAWAASIGGVGTIIGTPPNGIALGVLNTAFGQDPSYQRITFLDWMSFGVPFVLLALPAAWLLLLRLFRPDVRVDERVQANVVAEYRSLGPLTKAQRRTVGVFVFAAFLWVLLPFKEQVLPRGIATMFEWLDEYGVGLLAGVLLFFVPAGDPPGSRLLHWEDADYVEWGTLLLFGGGIALSDAMFKAGLAHWLTGTLMTALGGASAIVLLGGIIVVSILLTEVASNTAVATMLAPIIISLARASGTDATILVVGSAMGASLAFMLPVSTPPNALVYGTGFIRIRDMVKGGIWLDAIGGFLAAVILTLVGTWLLGLFRL
jgi:sodium-dependent dicarboxylate transporter 2/3/5